MTLTDTAGNTGSTNFAANPAIVSTTGAEGDTVAASIEVFDEACGHLVVLQRWLVDQTPQCAEVMRLRPEADA